MTGFVYGWLLVDGGEATGKYYVGSHKGVPTDGYIGSGKVFKHAVKKYGIEAFARTILYEGPDFQAEEHKILASLDAENDPMSYNLKNDATGATLRGSANGMFNKQHTELARKQISETLRTGTRWGSDDKKTEHSKKVHGEKNGMFGKTHSDFSKNKFKNTLALKSEKWKFLRTGKHHATSFLTPLKMLARSGLEFSPRGQKTIELENFSYVLPPYVRFCNFEVRKFKLDYVKKEFLWYLRGDRYDTSITEFAGMWKSLIQPDGGINSNYGQYIFSGECNQFQRVIDILKSDKDSRRATISILQPGHVLTDTTDQPCTYSLRFSIRNNMLGMSVRMRSQDAIFGMGNDAPCFSFIHEMVQVALTEFYPDLVLGEYYHSADSFHVYERHFEMLENLTGIDIVGEPNRKVSKSVRPSYQTILCPKISSPEEVKFLLNITENIPDSFEFTKWLVS